MSTQLADSRAGGTFVSGNGPDLVRAVLAILENLPLHTTAAEELGQRFREYHNPQNFMKSLMRVE